MKYETTFILLVALTALSCKDTVTNPTSGINLISNSSFDLNGTPSLQGWTVSDTSGVRYSTDIPQGGSGYSIVLGAQWFAPWPNGSIFVGIPTQNGPHRYRLSNWGKKINISGGVFIYLNRPTGNSSQFIAALPVVDTLWTFYSRTDTITTIISDSLFINISGGGTEIASGTTYFNTCKFEKLD